MNPFVFIWRRPITTLMVVVGLVYGGVFGLNKMRAASYPPNQTPQVYVYLDSMSAKYHQAKEYVVGHYEAYFHKHAKEEGHAEHHKILVTSPMVKDVVVTQDYVCQIHSRRQIDVQAFDSGYLESIPIKEGQAVKEGDLMFKLRPILYEAKLDAEMAEVQLADLEYKNTKRLSEGSTHAVSQNEVLLYKAKLAKAEAKKKLAEAELNFATIKAPFDGIVDRLQEQQGSLIKEGDILTTLSDNSVMWVYFNVPEKRYLEYMAEVGQNKESPDIELRLASLNKFPLTGKIGAIEAKFNPETGNIPFRADFPNPNRLLRHGQTGNVVISRSLKDAIVIPQRATYETLAKRYVFVVDKDDIVHQREIAVQKELEDNYIIESGLAVTDKIVLEGIRQVHDGEKVEFEYRAPNQAMTNQKFHAE